MSELWINFLQKEAAAREMGSGEPTSPRVTTGSEPGTPTSRK
jgi:hypothetical protein